MRIPAWLIPGILAFGLMLLPSLSMLLPLPAHAAPPLGEAEMRQQLQTSWEQYKSAFIQSDGRVIDFSGNISTSEGQSYAMLRAFWMRDRETFDKTYQWAKNNLQIPRGDHLFSWKWGELPDHTWGALDTTSAADADQDIALALILAHKVWQEPAYLADARLVLNDIWDHLTIITPLGRVLLPGDWPQGKPNRTGRTYQVNPSYFAPYAYRVFAEADDDHDWSELIESSYEIINRAAGQADTHLPPDWVEISLDNDNVGLYQAPLDARSDFGYEAIRVYWRVALDAQMMPLDKRPKVLLSMKTLLPRYWKIRKDLPISLTWDGIVRHPDLRSGAVYGALLPALYLQDRDAARDLLAKKIIPNLKPGGQWNTPQDYYSQNWLWFGLALYALYIEEPPYLKSSATKRLADLMRIKPD